MTNTDGAATAAAPSGVAELVEEFWTARKVLAHIREFARSRRAGPWGALGVAMARTVTAIPPTVTLPPVVGGRMSLNLFIALVGPSGSGKGACEAAGRDALVCSYDRTGQRPVVIEEFPLGSGEGVARTFRAAGLDEQEPNSRPAALFSAPEVDTLAALMDRSGATLEGELRKLYSGESIGFNNAGKLTRSVVAAHSYRACLICGVQPLRAKVLLDGADGGTPQRQTWLPVTDEDAPDHAPAEPAQWIVQMPQPIWQPGSLAIPQRAHDAIDAARLARLRGQTDENALDGHALLSRLKIAAALMALDGRTEVDDDDWNLAAVVMAVSNATRRQVQAAVAEQALRSNKARALATAEREEIITDRKLQRACDRILYWLAKDPLAKSNLYRKLKVDIRDYFGAAVADLIDRGLVTESDTDGKVMYTLTPQGHGTPGTHTDKPSSDGTYTGTPRGTRVPTDEHHEGHVSLPVSHEEPSPTSADVVVSLVSRVPRVNDADNGHITPLDAAHRAEQAHKPRVRKRTRHGRITATGD
ncbi:hypothetical protein [Nocardia aurea]|uniref:hypothetical protein n=1 Tax=Nocardia aurea TaxID=2144174 RepID=UPI0033B4BFCC